MSNLKAVYDNYVLPQTSTPYEEAFKLMQPELERIKEKGEKVTMGKTLELLIKYGRKRNN